MQYILTEDEYQKLLNTGKKREDLNQKELQDFCTRVANELPIKFWNNKEAKPWGCLLTYGGQDQEWYCDECPAQDVCPYPYKEWSK